MNVRKHLPKPNNGDGLANRLRSHRVSCRKKWTRERQSLLDLREALLQRIRLLESEASDEHPIYSLHPADAATDSFDRDLVLGFATFDQELLYQIDDALGRIADGTYGICQRTGKRIPKERLLAVPWARFSVEEEGFSDEPHPHLGSRSVSNRTELESEP
jgi:RNA polymerase-binding transcription factor DksA